MKKTLSLLAGGALLCLALPQANAATFTYTDHWINWPGYDFGDTNDVHGHNPQIEQMVITTNDSNILQSVQVLFAAGSERLTYDSLFINSYNTTTTNTRWDDWDYFVHDGGNHGDGQTNGTVPADGLYSVNANYTYTTAANYRTGNPDGIDAGSLTALDSSFAPTFTSDILTYDLASYNIDVSDGFFFAYAPWCANDVMGTPEPATMLLFGTGLIGLIGIGRRRSRRS